ncbi:peptidylprolyl isomerase [[Clostridium] polysaccharolyticum]|uniref:PPIC-type PPIASE domain-containing protein n=1 Tax=[Clostridium] polysaccharolyticum TaxID=29364 RepID=A0A1H9YSU1_9FIRM|nr:hypothetical protein [[Clostridium] polysaccharolyticum]SES72223.1 hypothetical protein SAMN04487772_102188 [[Clostridium] polysaccharolyticum]
METNKTTLQNSDVDGKKNLKTMEKERKPLNITALIMCSIGVILVIAMVAGVALENFRPRVAMTISKEKVTMGDVMYYLYTTEMQGNYMDSMYRQFYGQSYWDMQDEQTGLTYRDSAKQQAEQTIEQYNILYREAVKAGYKVTKEDTKKAQKDVKQIRKNLTFEQKNKTGFTKGALQKALEKKYVADRFKKDTIDGFDIDDKKIRDGVKKADFRQYDVQYYSIPTQTQNDKNETVDVDKKTLETYKAELEELANRAKTEDFDSLTPEAVKITKEANSPSSDESKDESDKSKDENKDKEKYKSNFTTNGKFVAGDGTFTTEVENVLKKMKNGEVSQVIEGQGYLYLVKMVNNNDDEAYETEVKNQITTEENKQFDTWYQDVFKKYTVSINSKVWDGVKIGDITAK